MICARVSNRLRAHNKSMQRLTKRLRTRSARLVGYKLQTRTREAFELQRVIAEASLLIARMHTTTS